VGDRKKGESADIYIVRSEGQRKKRGSGRKRGREKEEKRERDSK
jgi:hypothetical protein